MALPNENYVDHAAGINNTNYDFYSPRLGNDIASEYSNKAYNIGDYCIFRGQLYCCTTAIPSGEGTTLVEAHWTPIKTTDEISDLKNALNERTLVNEFIGIAAQIKPRAISKNLVPHSSIGHHIEFSVKPGDVLKVSGFVFDQTNYPLIILIKNSNVVGVAGNETTGAISNYKYIVPKDVDTIYVNGSANNVNLSGCPSAYKQIDVQDQISAIKTELRVDEGLHFDKTTQTSTGVVNKNLALNTGIGKHYVVSVSPGDLLLISGFEYDNGYPLAVFAYNDVSVHRYIEVGSGRKYNIQIIVPENTNQIYINTNGSSDPKDGGPLAILVYSKTIQEYVRNPMKWNKINITPLQGNISSNGSYQDVRGIYANIDVSKGEIIKLRTYETIYPTIIAYNGNTIVNTITITGTNWRWIDEYLYEVPENITKIVVNGQNGINIYKLSAFESQNDKNSTKANNNWSGKTGVWFGTSIPAAGYIGDKHISYPRYVGDMLGMDIINEAVGSSCVHCKKPDRISTDNPYGFIGNFEAVSRCLTNTIEEMQWIIDHYNSSIWTNGTVSTMTETLANQIRSFSYQNKLDKYLSEGHQPDVFIFDHGNNDAFNTLNVENEYYNQYGEQSLYTFHGAMNFLIKRIRNYNPYAKILLIGQYSGIDTDQIPAMQLQVAMDWNLPICKQWERLGWTKTKSIICKGHWSTFYSGAYIWVEDSSESNSMTVFARWVPDGLHPHTDISGKALYHIANSIASWMINIF